MFIYAMEYFEFEQPGDYVFAMYLDDEQSGFTTLEVEKKIDITKN